MTNNKRYHRQRYEKTLENEVEAVAGSTHLCAITIQMLHAGWHQNRCPRTVAAHYPR